VGRRWYSNASPPTPTPCAASTSTPLTQLTVGIIKNLPKVLSLEFALAGSEW